MRTPQRLLTIDQVARRLALTERALRGLIRSGRFPPGVRLLPRGGERWFVQDVEAYLWLLLRGFPSGQA